MTRPDLAPRYPDALVIMAKPPRPGRVKTRLCPPLTPEEAAGLYRAFLVDIGRETRAWPRACDRYVAWAGEEEDAPDDLREALGDGFRWLRQVGDDLTARMERVFTDLQQAGYRRVVMRNSDTPHLPMSLLAQAFDALDGGALVLGPDLDGGYYLAGLDCSPDGVFPRIMSTESVLAETARLAGARGLRVVQLEPFLDVDNRDDLAMLWLEFGGRADVTHWATHALLDASDYLDRLGDLP